MIVSVMKIKSELRVKEDESIADSSQCDKYTCICIFHAALDNKPIQIWPQYTRTHTANSLFV